MAPRSPLQSAAATASVSATALAKAQPIKELAAQEWLKKGSAIFAVGVSESLDHPGEVALITYVDRKQVPAYLPVTYHGLRVRYLFLDRLHVTRSWLQTDAGAPRCQQSILP